MSGSGIKSQILLVESCLATALQHPWGIRIWVGNEQKFKRLFYQFGKEIHSLSVFPSSPRLPQVNF